MINGINHITLSARDIEESFYFYRNILGFEPLVKWERGAYFLAGELWFCLSLDPDFEATNSKGHIAFSATKQAIADLEDKVKSGVLTKWTENTSEGDSLYILDPSGNRLELHEGNWQTRLESIKKDPYSGKIEFFI